MGRVEARPIVPLTQRKRTKKPFLWYREQLYAMLWLIAYDHFAGVATTSALAYFHFSVDIKRPVMKQGKSVGRFLTCIRNACKMYNKCSGRAKWSLKFVQLTYMLSANRVFHSLYTNFPSTNPKFIFNIFTMLHEIIMPFFSFLWFLLLLVVLLFSQNVVKHNVRMH